MIVPLVYFAISLKTRNVSRNQVELGIERSREFSYKLQIKQYFSILKIIRSLYEKMIPNLKKLKILQRFEFISR